MVPDVVHDGVEVLGPVAQIRPDIVISDEIDAEITGLDHFLGVDASGALADHPVISHAAPHVDGPIALILAGKMC